jgi:alpha-glucosidase
VKITPQVDVLPVFVRAGSILPFAPVVESTQEKPEGPLTLKVYPGEGCEGSLYQDDGISFAYKQKDFLRVKYSCESTQDGLRLQIGTREGSFQPWWSGVQVTIFGWNSAPGKISYAGQAIADARFDVAAHSLTVVLPERADGGVLEIGGR